ncbi:serine hydrolase [marine bacterium AO1-C]|nr:serine hydrolase [marine bacterium AO1-C]
MSKIITLLLIFWASSVFGQTRYQKYFDSLGVKGSTSIYDYKNKQWIFTDEKDADVFTLPASTFKIPNSLFALEYKAVKNENEVFKWDGVPKLHLGKVINIWNKDTNLKNAYKYSTVWVYVEVAKRIGRNKYESILNKCSYGNGNFSEQGIDFWNYGDFAISPKNQIDFLVKLYENKLPFSKTTIEKVKELMVSKQTKTHTYRSKTGWTRKNGQDIGWWVGYVEAKNNVYFFATRLIKRKGDKNPHFLKGRKAITKLILANIERQR